MTPEGCCPNCGLPIKEPPAFKALPDVPLPPLFTPEEIALIRSLADCLKIFAPSTELEKLRAIAEKMSAPSDRREGDSG